MVGTAFVGKLYKAEQIYPQNKTKIRYRKAQKLSPFQDTLSYSSAGSSESNKKNL